MASLKYHLFTLCIITICVSAGKVTSSETHDLGIKSRQQQTALAQPSVYEILPQYGLPSGLLPKSVKSYTLSESDGKFEVELYDTCYIKFDYTVYYEKKITGTLKYGSITDLKGIQVKRLFLWFDVDEIRVDLPPSDSIYFQVGIINKKLDVDQFKTVRSCNKNRVSGSKTRSWKLMFELPPPIDDEIQMLLTE